MGGYISEMRKLVGHRTIIQCGSSVICVDAAGRLLLGRRSDNLKWGYSGGSLEIDERVEDCAKRELFEETGLIADELEFFCVNSGPEAHYIYPNGDEVSNFEIVYLCRKWHGTMRPQKGEIEELRFFRCDELDPETVSPPIRPVLEKYLQIYCYGEGSCNEREDQRV
ncbi:MAG: NUDIX domain-containing protein [Clostridia bacterium]|nr:NUDIX domain-containing protein [Clostridia bacterium]